MVSLAPRNNYEVFLPNGTSPDSEAMGAQIMGLWAHIENSTEKYSMSQDTYRHAVIRRVLKDNPGYATVRFIARKARLDATDTKRLLEANAEFRRSLLKTRSGDSIYFLNARYAGIRDVWKTFCHIAYIKY